MSYRRIIHFKQLTSTNTYGLKTIAIFYDFDVIIADIQTAGKGRQNSAWYSDNPHNLYFSVILKDSLINRRHKHINTIIPNISQIMSIAIAKTLNDFDSRLHPVLKWPNDVLLQNKKVAGVLSETSFKGNSCEGIVVGAGINIRLSQKELAFINLLTKNAADYVTIYDKKNNNARIPDGAISLYQLATDITILDSEEKSHIFNSRNNCIYESIGDVPIQPVKQKLLERTLSTFYDLYMRLLSKGFASVKNEYMSFFEFVDYDVTVVQGKRRINGKIKDIGDAGELVIYDYISKQTYPVRM